jgi:hypothetical protein
MSSQLWLKARCKVAFNARIYICVGYKNFSFVEMCAKWHSNLTKCSHILVDVATPILSCFALTHWQKWIYCPALVFEFKYVVCGGFFRIFMHFFNVSLRLGAQAMSFQLWLNLVKRLCWMGAYVPYVFLIVTKFN